jgi:hypothetical protein
MDKNRRELTAALIVLGSAFGLGLTAAGMTTERREITSPSPHLNWNHHLQAAESAQGRGDVAAATRAWRDAYGAARRGRGWAAAIAVADAHFALPADARAAVRPQARELYMEALFRARTQHSLEGVLRAAEGFKMLGDREVVAQAVRIAHQVAEGGAGRETLARLRALADRS